MTLLTGTNAGESAIALDSVRRLDVSRGRGSHVGSGALAGLLLGIPTGAIVGAVLGSQLMVGEGGGGADVGAAVGAALVGASGLVIGTVVGALTKTERWEEVPLDRLRVSFAPRREGVALGLSIRF